MISMKPMDAVTALYADGHEDEAHAIVAGLSRAVFGDHGITPAGTGRRLLARLMYRVVRRTTRRAAEGEATLYRSAILERSNHPYARTLLTPSHHGVEGLVEGGDPMNGPYMMMVPEIRQAGDRWDRLFFNSVQCRDVQLRFIWETLATHAEASRRLQEGKRVHLKAVAAGTGLSMILAYDRLVRDGIDPNALSVAITDREASNTEKTKRLLAKLPCTRDRLATSPGGPGLSVFSEDAFSPEPTGEPLPDVVTAVGIFEYLQGHTCDTTERRQGAAEPKEELDAPRLAALLAAHSAPDASLIVNTYRPHASIRLLEVFGKKFDYRTRDNMAALLAPVAFRPAQLMGTGTIYDIEVYKKGIA